VRISQKAEYAVKAALDLTLNAPKVGGVRSSEVALRAQVPKKFLDAILLELRKGGFVSSKRGPDGGHWLARDPARITIGAILEAIDGPLVAAPRTPRRRVTPADACLEALWERVERAIRSVLDEVTLDDLRRQADTLGAVDFSI
jgi:Rrf2 family transcriptional regulator, cysteine metabolism repressor